MPVDRDWDVIVLGAGIAGLLIASEISKSLKTLVIERQDRVPTSKYWLTSPFSLENCPELEDCVDTYLNSLDFIAHDHTTVRVAGTFPLWSSRLLTTKLIRELESNDGMVLTGKEFYNYYYSDSLVIVDAGRFRLRTRLLIDTMGSASPIVACNSVLRIHGYYLLKGGLLRLRKPIDPIGLYNMAVGKNPVFVEVFPLPDGGAHVAMILPSRSATISRKLADDLRLVVHRSRFSHYFDAEARVEETYWGIIPVGRMAKTSLDRVYFFGESGQWNPAATATTLTRMLLYYKETADRLVQQVNTNRLCARELRLGSANALSRFNRQIQLRVFSAILKMNSFQFRELIEELKQFDDRTIIAMIFGDLRIGDVVSVRQLRRACNKCRSVIVRSAFRALLSSFRTS